MKNKKKSDSKWLLDFQGENASLWYRLNFLWNYKNIYIMDNHHAALWCWLQKINTDGKYDLFHLDRHFDTLYSNIDSWLKALPSQLEDLSLDDYLNLNLLDRDSPVIGYENYLSIFLEKYAPSLDTCWFSTYNEGDKPRFSNMQTPPPKSLAGSFEHWIKQSENPWIINVDIDLFFCDDDQDSRMQFHSDSLIKAIGQAIKRQNDKGKIEVITIALSPEWCGGWDNAKKACSVLTKSMGIDFKLPNSKVEGVRP